MSAINIVRAACMSTSNIQFLSKNRGITNYFLICYQFRSPQVFYLLRSCQDRTYETVAWAENSTFLCRAQATRGLHSAATRNQGWSRSTISAWFCTRTRWLAQTPTWHWVLTNGVSADRELLLRHVRGWGDWRGWREGRWGVQFPVNNPVPPFHSHAVRLLSGSPLGLAFSPETQLWSLLFFIQRSAGQRSALVVTVCEARRPGAV